MILRSLMRKDVLLLQGGGVQVHGRHWHQECMGKVEWHTVPHMMCLGHICYRFARVEGWIVPVHTLVLEYTHIRPLSLMRACVPGGSTCTSGFTSYVQMCTSDGAK
jgi:hypothetical protein